MRKLGAASLLLFTGAIASGAAAGEAQHRVCQGLSAASFEEGFPEQVRRYPFDGKLLQPFMQLWQATRRPDLPISPERVTVYAVPGRPYLIGYQSRGCLIAFLAIERDKLWSLLRPQIGWPA
jgi:hypothetical protein